ncbi:MAG: 2-iminobutanoate/2-iminopropanoate deaminase [Hyphomicrobiales bacterium]|jgi:2-iminobutanoate/2-iminopropanoate deaminase
MQTRPINAPDAVASVSAYAQALEVTDFKRLLMISGQIPVRPDGSLPEDFATQCRVAWSNVEAQLRAAGLTLDNLIKVTIFLSDRRYALDNRRIRDEVLGGRRIALTAIITGIFDEKWLLEIEAVAAE